MRSRNLELAPFSPRIDLALQCRWERCTLFLPCTKPNTQTIIVYQMRILHWVNETEVMAWQSLTSV